MHEFISPETGEYQIVNDEGKTGFHIKVFLVRENIFVAGLNKPQHCTVDKLLEKIYSL